MKLPLSDLRAILNEPAALFIGTASFEDRCCSILNELKTDCARGIIFKNKQAGEKADQNLRKMLAMLGGRGQAEELDLDEPMESVRSLRVALDAVGEIGEGLVFVDITTFTHEQLLILVRLLNDKKPRPKIVFGYNGADRYSFNTDANSAWLSKGVAQIRSVLGFPGLLLPSKRSHLIVLVGFEHERAKAVIERFEPNFLSLGVGQVSESVTPEHAETNRRFFDDVRNFVDLRTSIGANVNSFEFSCVDPIATMEAVGQQVDKLSDHNTVICPMNTKLSTLGVAMVASKNSTVQICYSRAIEYNELGYSTPSNQVTLFDQYRLK